jgi:hypothetical protein
MSYFADACVDSFTQEQKNAMAADILSRGWSNLAAPNPSAALSGTSVSAISPASGSAFPLSGNVTLSWAAVPNATGYVVVLERTLFGTPIETIQKSVVYGATSLVIPASKLSYPRQYTWRVKPFNQYQTCSAYSSPFGFTTQAPATAVENFASSFDFKILSNPLSNSSAELLLNVPNPTVAALNIYAMDGKQVLNVNNLELNAGDNVEMVDVSSLNNGVYIVVVTTPQGSVQQKLMIQR